MNKKILQKVAIILIIVFAVTIVIYPLIFGTDEEPKDALVELE